MSHDPLDSQKPNHKEGILPRGLAIRLFAYLIAGHAVAGFLYLLFKVGSRGQ
ncbi:DUF6126 family protein [Streptomyces sp. NBC_01497]|uniref:DUF6126 family protein n=1 Tax=Streptomyces sp. NBC_01497 TaxID=2903885 RepID=UPI002E350EBE|nr:DUF6126 family protein [Streptomyces sp. NBC_01497]